MDGWVKIYRRLLDSPIFTTDRGLRIWIWCLLSANHEGRDVYVGLQKVHVEPGQFVYSRKSASDVLKIPPSTTNSYLQLLKHSNHVDIKPTNKYSIVTILNWKSYQDSDSNLNSSLKTNEKQTDTNKKEKKDKEKEIYKEKENERKDIYGTVEYLKSIPSEDIPSLVAGLSATEHQVLDKAEELYNYCAAHGKKYHNYKLFLRNALRRDYPVRVPQEAPYGYKLVVLI